MNRLLLGGMIFGLAGAPLRAGDVLPLNDNPETSGTLTLNTSSVHVEGPNASDVNLPDILEADFTDAPFHLEVYPAIGVGSNQLPAGWKGQDIGKVAGPGSVTNAGGTFTLRGGGAGLDPDVEMRFKRDNLFLAGPTWAGDGQWTARLTAMDAEHNPESSAGLMWRDSPDTSAMMASVLASPRGDGEFRIRTEAVTRLEGTKIPSIDLPVWFRITRYGSDLIGSISTDGNVWDVVNQRQLKTPAGPTPWVGIFADSGRDPEFIGATFDNVSFTPAPTLAKIYLPGVVLQSGTFIAGSMASLNFDATKPDEEGTFRRGATTIKIPRSTIAAITLLPEMRSTLADASSQVGVILKNGDFLAGDLQAVGGNEVHVSSLALGLMAYHDTEVAACVLHPVQPQAAAYEVRLRDGSSIFASGLSANNGQIVVDDISGVAVNVDPGEVAQFRAGPAQAQNLLELNWKATPPSAPAAAPAAPATPPANPTPPTNGAPNAAPPPAQPANAAPNVPPPAECWEGNNEEQVMSTFTGTQVDFPLTGKFRALALRVALASDAPPNSQATIRILADGREIGRTPLFRAGDPPRFVEITLQNPQTVSLMADSIFAGTKVLFIDPVAIRGN